MAKKRWFWILYVIFALYLMNKAFTYVVIPESLLVYENWVFIGAGILLLLGAYNSFTKKVRPDY
jgi:hypothetical protein